MKLREAHPDWQRDMGKCYLHWCPGCEALHVINVEKPNHSNAIWRFDGNMETPTFQPSVNIVGRCHYTITAGQITFHGDSKHKLAGQVVPLPEIPEGE